MSNLSLLGPALVGCMIAARTYTKNRSPGTRRTGILPGARRTGASAGPKPVPVTLDHGDEELVLLRKAVSAADWPATAAILQPVRDRDDHERLSWLISCVEDLGGDFLLDLPAQRPEDPLALTVAGARHVAWAWEARSRARASQVSQDQFRTFHQRLTVAEEHLYAAVELDPESAAPWSVLTTSSRGMQHGHDVTRRRFEAGVRRAPHHSGLHAAMLQQLCAKWSGSHEQMHEFARSSLAGAPLGSNLGMLVAMAHIEHVTELSGEEAAAYKRSEAVRSELRQAAAGSVLHPAYAPTSSPYPALNAFAMAFWLVGDAKSGKEMFQRIGDHPTRFPWAYTGNPGKVFATARQACTKGK